MEIESGRDAVTSFEPCCKANGQGGAQCEQSCDCVQTYVRAIRGKIDEIDKTCAGCLNTSCASSLRKAGERSEYEGAR